MCGAARRKHERRKVWAHLLPFWATWAVAVGHETGTRRSMARRLPLARLPASALAAVRAPAPAESSATRFAGLAVAPSLLSRVHALGARKPLPIQEVAMPRIFAGESVALHSQTGSGKTLAYMLPLLARLRRDPVARTYVPRQALIVCPTRELAMQSCEYAQRLQPGSGAVVSGTRPERVRESVLGERAPLLFAASHQLTAFDELLAPDDEQEADLSVLPHVVRKQWYRKHTSLPRRFWHPERAAPSSFLAALRATLRTLVVDEADAVLAPRGKGMRPANIFKLHRPCHSAAAMRTAPALPQQRPAIRTAGCATAELGHC
jgi:hypothetical protein